MVELTDAAFLAKHLGTPDVVLAPIDIDALLDVVDRVEVTGGGLIFSQHDRSDDVYIVRSGRIALSRHNSDRNPYLQLLDVGDVFGDLGVFLGKSEPVDARVFKDCTLLRIAGHDLMGLLASRPRIALRWITSLSHRLMSAQDRLEDLLSGPLDHQVASLVLHASHTNGLVEASQQTIADMLGVRRVSVTRSLSNLEKRALIEKGYGTIRVLDRDGLDRLLHE